jgi:hypothetical protein
LYDLHQTGALPFNKLKTWATAAADEVVEAGAGILTPA